MNVVSSFVASEDHRLQRHTIGCRACLYAHRMPDRAAAELQDDVLAEQVEQLVHLAGMDAPGGHRHQLVEARPMLVEEYAMLEFGRIEILPADVIVAARRIDRKSVV